MTSSKLQRTKKIFPQSSIYQALIVSIQNTIWETWNFCILDNNGKHANRSSTKTDFIHAEFQEIFSSMMGGYRTWFEEDFEMKAETQNKKGKTKRLKVLDIDERPFLIDGGIYDKQTSKLVVALLCKAFMTSINKNCIQYKGGAIGEANRFFGNEDNLNTLLVQISFVPSLNYRAVSETQGRIKWEKTNPCTLSMDYVRRSRFDAETKKMIKPITLIYDWDFRDPATGLSISPTQILTLDQLREVLAYCRKTDHCPILFKEGMDEMQEFLVHFLESQRHKEGVSDMLDGIKHHTQAKVRALPKEDLNVAHPLDKAA